MSAKTVKCLLFCYVNVLLTITRCTENAALNWNGPICAMRMAYWRNWGQIRILDWHCFIRISSSWNVPADISKKDCLCRTSSYSAFSVWSLPWEAIQTAFKWSTTRCISASCGVRDEFSRFSVHRMEIVLSGCWYTTGVGRITKRPCWISWRVLVTGSHTEWWSR